MSPPLVAATSALLLACCVYLSVGTPIPVAPTTGTEVIQKRTATEAINANYAVIKYLKDAYGNKDLHVSATCSSMRHRIVLPCPQNVSGCNSMANISTNLNYLLYMYSHVLGFIYQMNSNETQMAQLDFLEMTFYRFSNQMQRFLQAHNLHLHADTICIKHQDIDRKVEKLQLEFTDMEIAKVVLCHLRGMARSTMRNIGAENTTLRGYKFCHSLPYLQQLCIV